MRFAIAVLILFIASFGSVFWYKTNSIAPVPFDVAEILKSEPEEYRRVYTAIRKTDAPETAEFDRAMAAYDRHRDNNTLRQDVSGLVLRAIDGKQEILKQAGLNRLEEITRKTTSLMRRYQTYGETFCSLSLQRNHANAQRLLAQNRRKEETNQLVEEFKQARFELVILMLEAIADGASEPVPVPNIDRERLSKALVEAASPENAAILEQLKNSKLRCDASYAFLNSALSITNDRERHAMLAAVRVGF